MHIVGFIIQAAYIYQTLMVNLHQRHITFTWGINSGKKHALHQCHPEIKAECYIIEAIYFILKVYRVHRSLKCVGYIVEPVS